MLYSYFFDNFTVSLIFLCNIFPIQEESYKDEDDSKESKPIIGWECPTWSCSIARNITKRETGLTWYGSRCISRDSYDRVIDKEERDHEHGDTHSRDDPFPDTLAENSRIKYSTNKSYKREDIEYVFQISWESKIDSSDIPSEVDHSNEDESKDNTSNTDSLVAWFLCELGECWEHRDELWEMSYKYFGSL